MDVLGLTPVRIKASGAYWTAREIAQQPQVWPGIAQLIAGDATLAGFLAPHLENSELRLVLTGAGTSSFIGECLAPSLMRKGWRCAEAIASTDIVADPKRSLAPSTPTLMVHFARSGNSPESVATMELAEQCIEQCAHLIVTCNRQGDLYRNASNLRRAYTVLLPEASNDQSFAMTSSFTGMLLAAALALRVVPADDTRIVRLARLGREAMTSSLSLLASLVDSRFERVVYLGSNELKGLAREAALKMLELTDGRVVSLAEAPLGFRHGPKTIVNGSTLVVAFLSNDAHTRQYDLDLLAELRRDAMAVRVVALGNRADVPEHPDTVVLADAAAGNSVLPGEGASVPKSEALLTDLELCLPFAVFAQSLALLRSISLGLSPDQPNATGMVNRVVQGVSIHPYGKTR
jgi:tagatose-6-phosphate ketose/aldose isomerase